jgi:hypothetical protein
MPALLNECILFFGILRLFPLDLRRERRGAGPFRSFSRPFFSLLYTSYNDKRFAQCGCLLFFPLPLIGRWSVPWGTHHACTYTTLTCFLLFLGLPLCTTFHRLQRGQDWLFCRWWCATPRGGARGVNRLSSRARTPLPRRNSTPDSEAPLTHLLLGDGATPHHRALSCMPRHATLRPLPHPTPPSTHTPSPPRPTSYGLCQVMLHARGERSGHIYKCSHQVCGVHAMRSVLTSQLITHACQYAPCRAACEWMVWGGVGWWWW